MNARSSIRSERGSAVVITLVVILAVTGLGAIAFNSAVTSAQTADHFGMQKRANYTAEVALMSGMEYLEANLRGVLLAAEGSGGRASFTNAQDIRTDISVGDYFSANPYGRSRLEPFFEVVFEGIAPARRAAEFDQGFCYLRLNMTGEAGIRDPSREGSGAAVSELQLSGGLISREFSAHFYVGPVSCPDA